MTNDANSLPVVVAGTGPAGATAARFLAEAGVPVLVLEAGSQSKALGFTARVAGLTVARRRPPLSRRGSVTMTGDRDAEIFEDLSPGGLSNHWSCAVPRFSREDFEDAARGGEANVWPVTYDDLVPYYERVEPLLHIAGTRLDTAQLPGGKVLHARELAATWKPVAAEARSAGRTIVPMPYAYGGETTLAAGGTAFNAFVRLLKPMLRSGRVSAGFRKRVLRLEWSSASRRVEAVIVRDLERGTDERVPCRGVVLAAGAVNTAQILLESQSADFPNGLGNTHGTLGRYLHDHPLGKVVIDLESPMAVFPPVYVTRATLEQSKPLYAAACMQWSGVGSLLRSVLERRPGKLRWIGFSVFGTMAPTPDDFVALDPERPRVDGASALRVELRHPSESRVALERARDDLIGILERAKLGARVRVWRVERVGNSVHYGGTCRMHGSPQFGMLDAWGRLHAVRNVAVADSAAFTTTPEKNPVLTAMTLAARASMRLAEDLASGDL